jgi:ribosome modulation factor
LFQGDIAMKNAFQEGYDAFQKGLKPENNPYSDQTEDKAQWEEGWEDAMMAADLKRPSPCTGQRPSPAG